MTPFLITVLASGLVASPTCAQTESAAAASVAAPSDPGTAEVGRPRRFVRDVGGDYKHFVSVDTARWLGVGGSMTLAVHPGDQIVRADVHRAYGAPIRMTGGQQYGAASVQFPLAIGWWAVGDAMGSVRAADAGRDLLRAQISATSWTYALKYAVNRTRPNGDLRSFPSGHVSSTFATAMVLQQHYGWKLGVPAFAAAGYTAASRVVDEKHWASDVAFGAFLGMVCARTVTVGLRETKLSISPTAMHGGAGVLVVAWREGT